MQNIISLFHLQQIFKYKELDSDYYTLVVSFVVTEIIEEQIVDALTVNINKGVTGSET